MLYFPVSSIDEIQFCDAIERQGYCIVPGVFEAISLELLKSQLSSSRNHQSVHSRKHRGESFALRNILHFVPEVSEFARQKELISMVESVLGTGARATKAILFDKTSTVNWHLRWHQDLTISVKEKIDLPDYGPWSLKAGINHVQPPVEVMQSILAARVHLDACGADNAALEVLPGSHSAGKLSEEEINLWKSRGESQLCECQVGDVLFMRPLLLHCSGKARKPDHRRVLHIEYSALDLPGGLEWGG